MTSMDETKSGLASGSGSASASGGGLDARVVVDRGSFRLDVRLTAAPGDVVALLALVLIRAAWRIYAGFRRSADPRAPAAAAVPRDAQWYRKEADRLHREGRWLEAMQADFTALIFLLERRQIVRYHPSKTPREYVREAALPEGSRAELGDLVWSLYRHLFGHEPVTAAAALAWRERTADDRYAAA